MTEDETNDLAGLRKAYGLLNAGFESACEQMGVFKQQVRQLTVERDKLQAFKDWVHAYLDAHGVPHHPPGPHGAEGCRIGDRMDWLMARVRQEGTP